MAERMAYVLDRDNAPRQLPLSALRRHFRQGNLSEHSQVSQNGETFEAIETASWFFEDDQSGQASPPTIPPSPGASGFLRSPSWTPPEVTPGEGKPRKSTATLNLLRPSSFRGSLRPLKASASSRSLKGDAFVSPLPIRSASGRGVFPGLPAPNDPGLSSPRSNASPRGDQTQSIFADKPEDLSEGLRLLSAELSRSLARAEALHFASESSFTSIQAENAELKKENAQLRAIAEAVRPVIAEHAPQILESMSFASISAVPPSTMSTSSALPPLLSHEPGDDKASTSDTAFGIPFDADSPMLREKMELFEAQLDEIRQSIKSCVKSGVSFVQTFPVLLEAGLQFAEDLQQSTLPMLKVLGEAIANTLDGQFKLLENMNDDFIQPLSRFANNDLKSANHIRAELERKRELFENLEAKYMSNRRGKERTSGVGGMTSLVVSASHHVDGTPRHNRSANSSGNFPPMMGGGFEDLAEKRSQNHELRAAEVQYELSRCKLIYTLNQLAMNHRVIVNRCVLSLASSMSSFHDGGSARALSLLENARVLGMEDPGEMQRTMEASDAQWKRKQLEIEQLHFAAPRRHDAEKDLIHEGWLWKRSSNVIRDWKKRFFQIVGGKLVYYRNMDREVVCDVSLCTVREVPRTSGREAAPPKTSFEVISNKRALVLMASSEEEKEIWVSAIRKAVERSLGGGGASGDTLQVTSVQASATAGVPSNLASDAMNDFLEDASNHHCFECKAPLESLNWVSINLGVFICISCSGVHRSLGTHVSKVRSLTLDKLPSTQLDILRRLGNARAAKIWEAKGGIHEVQLRGMAHYIREKYVSKAFLDDKDADASPEAFETVLIEDNLKRVAWFVAHGKPPFYVAQRTTALHVAASEPTTSAALCEFLLLNGSELGAQDEQGRTPADVANEKNATKAQSVFRCWAATSHTKVTTTEDV